MQSEERPRGWRGKLYEIIFGHETSTGKAFDIALIVAILVSVGVVILETVPGVRARHGALLRNAEWFFTILFTIEYLLRLICVRHPARYARSFYGIIDLVAIVPTYLSVIFVGAQALLTIRILRILRIFRILKLAEYLTEASTLARALRASRRKIIVFIFAVLTLDVILGSLMYVVEGPENGFTSIPVSIYWTIVTLTTVGYGDISPQTGLGQSLASLIMIIGYGIIAVPTGIVTAEIAWAGRQGAAEPAPPPTECPRCGTGNHAPDAQFCRRCGAELSPEGAAVGR